MSAAERLQISKAKYVTRNYKLPLSLQQQGLAKEVGMRELTSDEEIRANQLGNFDYMRAQYEAVKISICTLDGKEVDLVNNESEIFFEKIGAKGRTLLLKAYSKLSGPTKEEETSFFESEALVA